MKEAQNGGVLSYAIGLMTEEERTEAKKAGVEAFYPKSLADADRSRTR